MSKFICLLLITSFMCTSCCTTARGAEQKILVDSNPQGASVTIDDYDCGITPQYIFLERNQPHQVLIEKPGYQTSAHYLQPKVSAAVTSNILTPLAGGALGTGIGLICSGATVYGGLLIPGFALIGVALGSVIGIIGSGVDLYTGAGKTLNVDKIHAELHQ